MSLIKKASRSEVPIKIGMSGPSGSGKTYGAIQLASGLVPMNKILLIDTENGSGNLYSHLGDYSVLPFAPPFHPQRYEKAIQMGVDEKFECIIIDSTSHEWEGAGGILDIHNKLGGKFSDWAKATPMHKGFIDAILQCPVHVICTMRKKQDYSMTVENGKTKIEKVGLKEIQRDGFEYELTLSFDIDINHLAMASKDRTGLFSEKIPFKITKETGLRIKAWNSGKA